MQGVEILSSTTNYNTILPVWCMVVGLVGVGVCLYCAILLFMECYDVTPWVFVTLTIAFAAVTLLSVISNKNNINHIEYKVTIDDSVSMNEFLDKYEIIDQEGKIYTVKERE